MDASTVFARICSTQVKNPVFRKKYGFEEIAAYEQHRIGEEVKEGDREFFNVGPGARQDRKGGANPSFPNIIR